MPIAKRKNRSNPEWIRRHLTDPYVRAATTHGYRSRAAYKLAEIDDREKFLHPGAVVVDLGAAPGSWTQVAAERLRDKNGAMRGRIVALDLLPIEPVPEVIVLQGDFREQETEQALAAALAGAPVDVVLSASPLPMRRATHIWPKLPSNLPRDTCNRMAFCCSRPFTAAVSANWSSN